MEVLMNPDLELLMGELGKQAENVHVFRRYYSGDQPLMYTHQRLKDVFNKSTVRFIQNWCAVVVDSTADRIDLKGFDNPKKRANKRLDDFWEDQFIDMVSRQVHQDALVTGDGYVMLDRINGQTRAYYNSPDKVFLDYEKNDPNKKRAGIKCYYDPQDNMTRVYLYYPTRIEKYEQQGNERDLNKFILVDEYANDFGDVPIIHFSCQPELTNVMPIQDAINKTFSDMMVVSEFGAFPQRWMITNADISTLKATPQAIMQIPKGVSEEEDTSVGEFSTANLTMFLETIDKLTNSIAVISRTPKHYFFNVGANISGEALQVMEAPLIKKVEKLITNFEHGWLELAALIDATEGTTCVWERPETQQTLMETQAMKTMLEMGIPLVTILKQYGWTMDEIEQLKQDQEEQKLKEATVMDNAIINALSRLEQSNNPYNLNSLRQTQAERGVAE